MRRCRNQSLPQWAACLLLGALAGSLAGCGAGSDPRIAAERSRLIVAQEPDGATSIASAKKNLPNGGEVTLVGTIGAGQDDPFEKDRAAFVITELPDHDHAGHDAANCPFCKHRAANAPQAVVQLVDGQGKILDIDARRLLGVEKGQVVVVRGHGQLDPQLDLLLVTAQAIHVRR